MATRNALKNSTLNETAGKAGKIVVPDVKKTAKTSVVIGLIDKAIVGVRAMVQAVQQSEPLIAKAAIACVEHFDKHGDLGPADRLVKGIEAVGHPAATAASRELKAWFRGCSPIQWDLKGKIFKNKDENKGKIEVDMPKASDKAFFETAQAVAARSAMDRAHNNSLKEASAKVLVNRIMGQLKWFNNVLDGTDENTKIKTGEEAKMKKIAKAVQAALVDVAGKDAVSEAKGDK